MLLFYVLVFWMRVIWDLSFQTEKEPTIPAFEGKVLTPESQGGLYSGYTRTKIISELKCNLPGTREWSANAILAL